MNLLFDSHSFVWWRDEQHKLSQKAFAEISNSANHIFLSVASVWELQIKIGLGKFKLKGAFEDVIENERQINDVKILPINLSHALYLENLPLHHNDPFDRILIAQAMVENMILVSADAKFSDYKVNLLW